jgi:hypothetical protein
MKIPLLLSGALASCVLGLGVGIALNIRHQDQGLVYSVAQVQAGLANQPQAWVGRTVRVRGVVGGCPYKVAGPCASWQPELREPAPRSTEAGAGLVLVPVPARSDALTALLRRIPWVRMLVRGPQVVQWDIAATYQVELRTMPASQCGGAPCYEAGLQAVAP